MNSIKEKLYTLPDTTRVFVGHDYNTNREGQKFNSTIGECKKFNSQIKDITTINEFTEFRDRRDSTLAAPKLLLPSLQVNINSGRFPVAEDNGQSYLKIPLNIKNI